VKIQNKKDKTIFIYGLMMNSLLFISGIIEHGALQFWMVENRLT
jgi:hypothetical protein